MVSRHALIGYIFLSILALTALYQGITTLNDYARLWRRPLTRAWADTSFARSAVFYLKPEGANYLDFLDNVIPADGSVVIVPGDERGFSEQSILQFFLLDRTIIGCGKAGQASLECIANAQHFVPAIGDFPPAEAVNSKNFIPYKDGDAHFRGVYAPEGALAREKSPVPFYNPFLTALLDLVIVLAILGLGWLAVGVFLGRSSPLALLSLIFPIGMGLFTWVVFLWSWGGGGLSRLSVVTVYVALFALLFILRWWQTGGNPIRQLDFDRKLFTGMDRWEMGAMIGIGILAVVGTIIAIGRGYSLFDDMAIWSLKGYYMADRGTIFAAEAASGHGLSYPLNISLLVSTFFLLTGDLLPGSKMIFPLMSASLLLGCFHFCRMHGMPMLLALLGLLLILTVPKFFEYSTHGFANIPFTTYLVLGAIWSIVGFTQKQTRVLIMGGLLLSFAGWTRPEGIGFSYALGITLLVLMLPWRPGLKPSLVWLVSIGVISGTWLVLGSQYMGDDQIGRALTIFRDRWNEGLFNWDSLRYIWVIALKHFWRPDLWGWVVPVTLLLMIFSIPPAVKRRDPWGFIFFVLAIVAALIPAALFFVESFSEPDFPLFLSVSFDRAYFPALVLLVISLLFFLRNWWPESIPNPTVASESRPSAVGDALP